MAIVPTTYRREWMSHTDGPCAESGLVPAAKLWLPWSDDGKSQRGSIVMSLPAATGAVRQQIEGGHEFELPRELLGLAARATWTKTPQGLKFAAVLDKCPSRPYLDFALDAPSGARLHYQGELTSQEIDEGCARPADVVGSYAIYGARYGDKLGHLYRPYCCPVAKPLERAWCRMEWLPAAGVLRVHLPLDWLGAQQQWPVLLDPTLGDSGTGVSGGYTGSGDQLFAFYLGAMPAAGTLSSVHIYDADDSTVNGSKVGVYTGTAGVPSTRVFISAELNFATNPEFHVATAGGEALASGLQVYAACVAHANSDWRITYDATDGFWYGRKDATYDIPSPAPATWDASATNRQITAYITYVASGGGLAIPLAAAHYRRRRAG
jgi:hypothetical protein